MVGALLLLLPARPVGGVLSTHSVAQQPNRADIYEMAQQARAAIRQRWDKRIDTIKLCVGPMISLGLTVLLA